VKCIVKDCENQSNEGKFKGGICYPCHAFITNGEGVHSQVYRNTKRGWVGLTQDEFFEIYISPATIVEQMSMIEAKLKEKNDN
jgi:hypothetical protein